jgi:hypothetical protein
MVEIKRCKRKIKRKTENIYKHNTRLNLDYFLGQRHHKKGLVDGLYVYQTSFGLASRQVLRCSQGTLLPLSVNPRY